MNTSQKGWKKEKLCRDELEKVGWTIVFQSVRTRWATYDLADLFDVVAITFSEGIKWKFISVKNYAKFENFPKHQEEILQFKNIYGLSGMEFEIWFWSKARYVGRGKNKHWQEAKWIIKQV